MRVGHEVGKESSGGIMSVLHFCGIFQEPTELNG